MRTSFPASISHFLLTFITWLTFGLYPVCFGCGCFLFSFFRQKISISLVKSPGADSGFAFFGNIVYQMFIIIYFTTYQFLGQIFIALNFNYTRQDGQKRSSLLMEWSCRMENRKFGETRIYFRKLVLVSKPWEGKAFYH